MTKATSSQNVSFYVFILVFFLAFILYSNQPAFTTTNLPRIVIQNGEESNFLKEIGVLEYDGYGNISSIDMKKFINKPFSSTKTIFELSGLSFSSEVYDYNEIDLSKLVGKPFHETKKFLNSLGLSLYSERKLIDNVLSH